MGVPIRLDQNQKLDRSAIVARPAAGWGAAGRGSSDVDQGAPGSVQLSVTRQAPSSSQPHIVPS